MVGQERRNLILGHDFARRSQSRLDDLVDESGLQLGSYLLFIVTRQLGPRGTHAPLGLRAGALGQNGLALILPIVDIFLPGPFKPSAMPNWDPLWIVSMPNLFVQVGELLITLRLSRRGLWRAPARVLGRGTIRRSALLHIGHLDSFASPCRGIVLALIIGTLGFRLQAGIIALLVPLIVDSCSVLARHLDKISDFILLHVLDEPCLLNLSLILLNGRKRDAFEHLADEDVHASQCGHAEKNESESLEEDLPYFDRLQIAHFHGKGHSHKGEYE